MRKHRRRSGRYRFLIIFIIIIIAAAAALFRFAAGRRNSGEPGVVSGTPDTVVAEGSTLTSSSSENSKESVGGPQSDPSANSGSGISGQAASVRTSAEAAGTQPGTDTAPAGGGISTGTGTDPADSAVDTAANPAAVPSAVPTAAPSAAPTAPPTEASASEPAAAPTEASASEPAAAPTEAPASEPAAAPTEASAAEPTSAPAGGGTAAAGETAQGDGTGEGAPLSGTSVSDGTSTQGASAPKKHVVSELETGKAYLDSLDQRSPVEMEYRIDQAREVYEKEQDRKAYLKKREIYRQALEDDGVWDQFDKYVFLGDSRVVGFNVFGFLPEERILAEQGDTILAISDRIDEIRELDPSYIFISYGINDIGIGIWPTAGEYADAFGEKIDDLHKELPDAQIYVNSIIPATDEAIEGVSIWGKIPEYSDALKNMCAEKGIPFIDNTKLMEEHKELYAGDGVHLLAEFYPYWAQNQLLGIYDLKNGRNSEGYHLDDKTGGVSGQDPASKESEAGAVSGQDAASKESEAGEISGGVPVSNKNQTGTD